MRSGDPGPNPGAENLQFPQNYALTKIQIMRLNFETVSKKMKLCANYARIIFPQLIHDNNITNSV